MYVQRREAILSELNRHPSLTVRELSGRLKVSEMTIRRDVSKMEEEGVITRYFGGIRTSDTPIFEQVTSVRASSMMPEKRRIAARAASIVSDGDSIILDSGTTILELAKILVKRPVTIATSYLLIPSASPRINASIHLSGGELFVQHKMLTGRRAEEFYDSLNCKFVFLSSAGISLNHGITEYTADEASLKKTMLKHAKTKVLLMDSSKFNSIQMFRAAKLTDIDVVITDSVPPEEYTGYFEKHGISLIVA